MEEKTKGKTEHYFSKKQTSEFNPKKILVAIMGKEFELYTAGGVFASKKLDRGSALLINKAEVKKGQRILDLGCGYGVVGISIMMGYPGIEFVFSDVNERAMKLTKMNLRLHKSKGKMVCGSMFEKLKDEMFDVILLNPPQTAGKKICFQMIEESRDHLNSKGSLQLVARHQKGGKELEKKMKDVFGDVEQVAKKGGFRIYIGRVE